MYSFSDIIAQMRHDQKDMLKAYWSTAEKFSIPFYRKTPRTWTDSLA